MIRPYTTLIGVFLLLSLSSTVFAKESKISKNRVVNKFGFDLVGTDIKPCKKIKRKRVKKYSRCVYQGRRKVQVGKRTRRYTQYKCKFKTGETLIYNSKRICHNSYNATWLESN